MSTILMLIFLANNKALNLPEGLLESLCYIESGHNVTAIAHHDGNSDSLGICQIKLATARYMGFKGTYKQLMTPEVNIHYAGLYLKYNIWKYGSFHRALTAYNRGNAKNIYYSTYSKKVMDHWRLAKND